MCIRDRDGYDAYGIQIRPTASKVPENALVTVRNSGDKQSVITGVSGIYATTPSSLRQFPLALEGDIALESTAEVEQPLKLGYAYVVYTPEAAAIVKNGGFLAENDTCLLYTSRRGFRCSQRESPAWLRRGWRRPGSLCFWVR